MIVYRALQGFIGGGMIPSVFAVAFTLFPRQAADRLADHRPRCDAGADDRADGRRLPDRHFSWHWLFLVNVDPGIVVAVAVFFSIDFDKPNSAC